LWGRAHKIFDWQDGTAEKRPADDDASSSTDPSPGPTETKTNQNHQAKTAIMDHLVSSTNNNTGT
jgi:hypothetical protein